jgi:hypothetical protein
MRSLRFPVLGLLLFATVGLAQAAEPVDAMHGAMRCIRVAMTDSLLPVGVMNEQIANAALMRCSDEIENAAAVIAAAATKAGGIEATRAALRVELYDYAMGVAGGSYALRASASDASVDQRSW